MEKNFEHNFFWLFAGVNIILRYFHQSLAKVDFNSKLREIANVVKVALLG